MGWNGSGVVTRDNGTNSGSALWEADRDASIKITAENHDNHDQDLADAIQNCLTKDGQNYPSADLPLNNQKHTGVGNATAANHYAAAGQVQNSAFAWGGTAAGTADAITFNLTPTLTAYTAGMTVRFLANGTTTVTNPTININAAGAKTVKNQDGDVLAIGDIVSGTIYEAAYDGTDFRIYVAGSQDLSDYVTGPASTTENNVPQWDSTTKQLKDGLGVGSGSGDLLRVDGDGSGLLNTADQVARDMGATALAYAMAQNDAASIIGAAGTFYLLDDFETDSLDVTTNAKYDASGDFYVGESSFNTDVDITMDSNRHGLNNFTVVQVIPAAALSTSGASVKVTFEASSGGNGFAIKNCYIGEQAASGDAYDFETTPTQVTFDTGSAGFSVAAGATKQSDEITFSVDAAKTYLVSYSLDGIGNTTDDAAARTTQSGFIAYEKSGSDEAATVNKSGYSDSGKDVVGVQSLEIKDGISNVVLAPVAGALDTAGPTDLMGYFIFLPNEAVSFDENGDAGAGDDVIGKLSIDGNVTKATGSWSKVGDIGSDGLELWRLDADVSAQTGSSVDYEISTQNNADIEYHYSVGTVPLY
ncbi:hypothetical protein [Thalassospira alkalitolerans]|uniref:hypothetical protein n=1 Tax=Thalassospira alkalitolerans TaxID=1293890 RepID=UPI003AA9D93A